MHSARKSPFSAIRLSPVLAAVALMLAALFAVAPIDAMTGSNTAHAQDASAPFQGMRNSDEPVQIEANQLQVEDDKGLARFDGNVSVVQGTTILKTSHLLVYYYGSGKGKNGDKKSGKIKRIEASGKVAVRSDDQKATADNMTYDMDSQMVTLNGNVIVSQGPNILKGCKLTVNMSNNKANFTPCGSDKTSKTSNGRIKMILTPGSIKKQQ